ncbi:efflux RND transporter permease subunit [Marinitoga lauensis]|uniref:efflux RND transporter permease subunit n=1 Tax=Marinitoga lauensis TaxID=2201189 RepID=UPI00101244AB|nr:efflux RND transporter permease subunit [Marinitoga lauensis]
MDNLPAEIKQNYLGKQGMILTTAYSNGDMWKSDYQKKYFEALNKLNVNNVSGTALIFLRLIQISASEGRKILLLTIIFIFVVLLFDMKNIKYAILAMLPMVLSIILMLGVMGWFDIKFNVVNIIALPLIIGIGVDDGIHLIHRYRREKNINDALKSTGKAITMTTLTTGAAFGSFILAKYRGFVGFGLLLLLG